MSAFYFDGTLSASKSIMNRALICSTYSENLGVIGQSDAEDVQLMRRGLFNLNQGQVIDCGHAGTVLRFMALLASRRKGVHRLTGTERLFSRPQSELLPILGQLGVQAELKNREIMIRSWGWKLIVDGLQINAQRSSQFASAVMLNSWNLEFPLHITISKQFVSEAYFQMTVDVVKALGMVVDQRGHELIIPREQTIKVSTYKTEIDLSSAFAVAALAVVGGKAIIRNFPKKSIQPDHVFVQILKSMGVSLNVYDDKLEVEQSRTLSGIEVNLQNTPDLFPVLGVLCALAETPSQISGISHLQYKESSRLNKMTELIHQMGAEVTAVDNGIKIIPTKRSSLSSPVLFDVDQDHRLVMAVAVAQQAGFQFQINTPQIVNKSFPEFLSLVGNSLC